ncbi:MAG: hypothetical protein V3R66_07375, partial [Rhodospirillales bacterium]
GLEPKVVVSKMDGGELSLVVVGPFKSEMRRNLRSKVRRAGIFDAWAANIDFGDWSLVYPTEMAAQTPAGPADLAQLPQ